MHVSKSKLCVRKMELTLEVKCYLWQSTELHGQGDERWPKNWRQVPVSGSPNKMAAGASSERHHLCASIAELIAHDEVISSLVADTLDYSSCLGLEGSRFSPKNFEQLASVNLKVCWSVVNPHCFAGLYYSSDHIAPRVLWKKQYSRC